MNIINWSKCARTYVLPDGVLARLTVLEIDPEGPAVRLSYPGLGMHAGYMAPSAA